ncbi:hypothetical protein GCM10027570_10840 [Streptomonospora sediminis]
MECLILAAGAGRRLHPLTRRLPKPLLPIGDTSVLGRLVGQVADLPLDRVLCNLHFRAEAAQRELSAGDYALPVHTRIEPAPRGPAGSLHTFASEAASAEAVLVVSGDLYLGDGALAELARRHRETGALLSVLAVEVDDGSHFGVFRISDQGTALGLAEKPGWAANRRSWVSGGAYCVDPALLERIPTDREYDFGAHLIPALLEERAPVTVVPWLGAWSDLGTPAAYRDAVLRGVGGPGTDAVHLAPGAEVHPTARLSGRVYFGAGATAGAGADIRDAVILPGARVPDGAAVVDGCFQ